MLKIVYIIQMKLKKLNSIYVKNSKISYLWKRQTGKNGKNSFRIKNFKNTKNIKLLK